MAVALNRFLPTYLLALAWLMGGLAYAQPSFTRVDPELINSSVAIDHIYQNEDGLVFLATTSGLILYDGETTTSIPGTYHRASELKGQSVMSPFFPRSNGDIWYGTEAELVRYDGRAQCFHSFPIGDSTSREPYYPLALQADRYLWVSVRGELHRIDTEDSPRNVYQSIPAKNLSAVIGTLWVDEQEQSWLVSSDRSRTGLDFHPVDEANRSEEPPFALAESVAGLVYDQLIGSAGGEVWAKAESGLLRLGATGQNFYPFRADMLPVEWINPGQKDNELWILSHTNGLWSRSENRPDFHRSLRLPAELTGAMADKKLHLSPGESRQSTLWLFVRNSGLYCANLAATYPRNRWPVDAGSVRDIQRNAAGQLVLDGPGDANYLASPDGEEMRAIFPFEGRILGSRGDGYFVYSERGLELQSPRGADLISRELDSLRNVAPVGRMRGHLLIRHRHGLLSLDTATFELRSHPAVGNFPLDAEPLPDGRLALIFADGSLRLHPVSEGHGATTNAWRIDSAEAVYEGLFILSQLAYDQHRNWLWVAGLGGLYALDEAGDLQFFGPEQGLPVQAVRSMAIDRRGVLWLAGTEGIFNFSPDPSWVGPSYHFRAYNGLSSDTYTRAASMATPAGFLWFGSERGVDVFHPDSLSPFDNPPRPLLRELYVLQEAWRGANGEYVQEVDQVVLPYHQNTLSFQLAAPEYTSPERVEYRAFLVNGAGDTTIFALGTDPQFELFNQAPDSYHFGFTAKSAQGVWAENPYWLSIEIYPHWSQSFWFRLLLVVFSLAIAALITTAYYRYRLKVSEAEATEARRLSDLREAELQRKIDLEEQRRQITARIHNEVGGNLTTISMLSSRIDKARELDKTKTLNERITQRVRETRRRFSSFLRAINPQFDDLDKTLQLVRSDTAEMLQDNDLHATYDWPKQIPERRVSPEFRLGFFELVREIVNNIMKSARASHLHLHLDLPAGERLELSILDDGTGFVPTPEDFEKGIGLSSLQRISKELGGSLTYELREGGGTKTHISLPLPPAQVETNQS